MSLGRALKSRRTELGLTLREVERRTKGGISNGYLSLLESDEVKQPSPHHLYMLATALEMDYADLIELAGYMVPHRSGEQVLRGGGIALAGWEDLTDAEQRAVEELAQEQVRLLKQARRRREGPS